jgi:hypothetical protein
VQLSIYHSELVGVYLHCKYISKTAIGVARERERKVKELELEASPYY